MRSLLNGSLDKFAINYFLENQSYFARLRNINDYVSHFHINDSTLRHFESLAKTDSVYFDLKNPQQAHQLALQIKQLTARLIWGTQGFFEVKNPTDSMFTKSLQALNN